MFQEPEHRFQARRQLRKQWPDIEARLWAEGPNRVIVTQDALAVAPCKVRPKWPYTKIDLVLIDSEGRALGMAYHFRRTALEWWGTHWLLEWDMASKPKAFIPETVTKLLTDDSWRMTGRV